jgi:hypothetical protein
MSTSTLYLPPEEVSEFIEESLVDDYLYTHERDRYELGLCPYITFYIYHDKSDYLAVSEKCIQLYNDFQQVMDERFQIVRDQQTEEWVAPDDPRLPKDYLVWAQEMLVQDRSLWIKASDQEKVIASPLWSFSATVTNVPEMEYSVVKMIFRHRWYNQNKDRWHSFVNQCIETLQPEQCYSGFEVGNGDLTFGIAYENGTMERICADYFYGVDVDHPLKMCFHFNDSDDGYVNPTRLGAGLRTPTWCFLLSPIWLSRLGKTEEDVRAELDHPDITITSFPYPKSEYNPDGLNALWVQLGELNLYPVGQGKPELLVKANQLIRPIRCDELELTKLQSWNDDPNPRFDYHSGVAWMQRFDDDSDWLFQRVKSLPLPAGIYEAKPGETVPKAGWWYSMALKDKTEPRYFEKGQQLPFDKTNEEGDEVLWYRQLDTA